MKINDAIEWGTVSNPGIAAELVRSSWSDNQETAINYDDKFVRSCLAYPSTDPIIAPALYHGNELIAFVLGIPRRVSLDGQYRKLALMSFFTVASDWKGRRLGVAVWAQCLHQAREAGYDGSIHFCVDGNISNHATFAGAREVGLQVRQIFTVRYLMRFLRSNPLCGELSREPSIEDFAIAANSILPLPLARLWTPAEAEWQCRRRVDPICVTYRNGARCGALAGYRLCSLDSAKTAYSFIDDILWPQLTGSERASLLQLFLQRAAKTTQVAIVPLLGYADMSPFFNAGFRRSARVVHCYLTMWNGNVERGMRSVYMDVL